MTWTLVAGPARGAPATQLTGATDRKLTFSLTEPSSLGFTVDGRADQALDLLELATDVHALRDGVPLYTGRVLTTSDDFDDASHATTVSCTDAKGLLARRAMPSDLDWTREMGSAWRALLTAAQAFPNTPLGITVPAVPDTGVTVTRKIKAGASVLAEIQAIQGGTEGDPAGFDWDVTPGWANRTAQFWAPRRGRDLTGPAGVVLDYTHRRDASGQVVPRSSPIAKISRAFDPSTYANYVRVTGGVDTITVQYLYTDPETGSVSTKSYSYDVPTTPVAVRDGLTVDDIGTWAATEAYADIVKQPELQAKSDARAADLGAFTPTYTVTLKDGWWDGPDHIWLGDTLRLILDSGRLREDASLRVTAVDVALGDDGQESVTLTVGPTRRDEMSVLLAHARRLALLERTR